MRQSNVSRLRWEAQAGGGRRFVKAWKLGKRNLKYELSKDVNTKTASSKPGNWASVIPGSNSGQPL